MQKTVFLLVAMVLSTTLFAQLKVDSLGTVIAPQHLIVGTTFDSPAKTGLYVHQLHSGSKHYGIYANIGVPMGLLGNFSYAAIYGEASMPAQLPNGNIMAPAIGSNLYLKCGFAAGVVGKASGGIGVYGSNGQGDLPTSTLGSYAGYFAGDMKVTGTLSAAVVSTTSDQRLKENIQSISDTYLANELLNLRPVSFNYKLDTTAFTYNAESQEIQNTHYGLLAQEVQTVLPDVVYENQDGYLSINYTELIPLLIQTVKDLNEKVSTIEKILNQSNQDSRKTQGKHSGNDIVTAALYQNTPNPFTETTIIEYALPTATQSATLYIYDMRGTQLESFPITQFGQGSITITANQLPAGVYLYSLVADGNVIDIKQMILTK